jgi:hypothetical protein
MSGAAAISAAKNRRGNSGAPPAPVQTNVRTGQPVKNTPQQSTSASSSNSSSTSNSNADLPKPTNPMQALQLHEIRLNRNDKAYLELEKTIHLLSETVNANQLQQKQPSSVQSSNNDNTQLYQGMTQLNERISHLEELFNHIKEDIFRVQTFAMETNLSFLKYKSNETAKSIQLTDVPTAQVQVPTAQVHVPLSYEPNVSLQINEYTTLEQIVDISQ